MELDKDFREFIGLLNEHEVRYLVVGGYAVNYHGYPRYTRDIDFWVWLEEQNIQTSSKSKQAMGRLQDLADAEQLERLKKRTP